MRFAFLLLALCLLLFASCATSRHAERRFSKKIQKEVEKSPVFNRALTGFTLLDPATGKTLADLNGDKYFTPASNTKILTLATCLEVLGDSVPGLQYVYPEDAIVFQGTGDPTFLHPKFEAWQPARHLLYRPPVSLLYVHRRFEQERFGPGWAWDDYNEAFQPERSAMPIYGNCFEVIGQPNGIFHVEPTFFNRFFLRKTYNGGKAERYEHDNWWTLDSFLNPTIQALPFRTILLGELLSDTLKRPISELHYYDIPDFESPKYPWRTLYSTPLDTVLRRMMHQSDNFIAEQMLLVCAGQKFDILRQDTMIKWMLDSIFNSLPQRPRWVDGSGLSRYNLISPRDLAQVLLKLWKEQPYDFLFSLFPAGGVSGTIADLYEGKNSKPYIFAKTGSLSGVHCLSGYIVCKSGKTLIFSFMHNNFVGSNRAWKAEMQRILEQIRDGY